MEWRRFWKCIKVKEMKKKKEIDSSHLHIIQELQALWEITVKKSDQEEKKILWN